MGVYPVAAAGLPDLLRVFCFLRAGRGSCEGCADLVRVFRFRSAGLFLFPVPDVLQVLRFRSASVPDPLRYIVLLY